MTYVIIGLLVGEMAQYGHRSLYGKPMPVRPWLLGVALWPLVAIVGFMKK
jgi:hypothetical protein